jgi:hypothetical protein
MSFVKFPHIDKFSDCLKDFGKFINRKTEFDLESGSFEKESFPFVDCQFTIKIHGTNAAIGMKKDGTIWYQSRNRVLTLDNDNFDFALAMSNIDVKTELFDKLDIPFEKEAVLFGEYAGKGIQDSVAVNQVERFFVIFALYVDGEFIELPENIKSEENRIFNILQFENSVQRTDFCNIEQIQEAFDRNVERIEKECPVGKYFGVEGVGEGFVITFFHDGKRFAFKVKGEQHRGSNTEKIKTPKSDEEIGKIQLTEEFVAAALTKNRLDQGFYFMKNELQLDHIIQNVGAFIKWCQEDIGREERNEIVRLQLNSKLINNKVAVAAKSYYFQKIKTHG